MQTQIFSQHIRTHAVSHKKVWYVFSILFFCIFCHLIEIIDDRASFFFSKIAKLTLIQNGLSMSEMIITNHKYPLLIEMLCKIVISHNVLDHSMRDLQNRLRFPFRFPDCDM